MFAFVVFGLVSSVLAKRLTAKNVFEITYFLCQVGCKTLTQSWSQSPGWLFMCQEGH